MDDETVYGPEFHRLSFGDAVERGLLTDYKVLVLTVDEELVAGPLQEQIADGNSELQPRRRDQDRRLLERPGQTGRAPPWTANGFAPGELPMRRAVAFLRDIKASKQARAVPAFDGYRTC